MNSVPASLREICRRPRRAHYWIICVAVSCSWLLPCAVRAQVLYLDHQHMDLRLEYHPTAEGSNQLDTVLGYDSSTNRFIATNHQVYIVGGLGAQLIIPANPDYAFLGAAGSPVWILPQSQNLALPYLGVSGEDLPSGVFSGPLNLELVDVYGPGNFFVWQTSGAGQPPIIKMIFTNGVVNPAFNKTSPLIGSHEHFNWGFSTNGLYLVTFRVTGQLLGQVTNLVGKPVTWAFEILQLRPWEQWVSTNWLPATLPDVAGPAADPDHDCIPNVFEYALGLDPNFATNQGLPGFSFVSEGPQTFGGLVFTRVKSATDLDYLPVVSSSINPSAWQSLTNVAGIVDQGDTETVTFRDDQPVSAAARRFYQLRVRLNYP